MFYHTIGWYEGSKDEPLYKGETYLYFDNGYVEGSQNITICGEETEFMNTLTGIENKDGILAIEGKGNAELIDGKILVTFKPFICINIEGFLATWNLPGIGSLSELLYADRSE